MYVKYLFVKRSILFFVVLLFQTSFLFAASDTPDELFEKAKNAYYNDQYKKAFTLFTMAKDAGEYDALAFLADMYENGYSVKKDFEKSKELLEEGVSKGSPLCMNDLGNYYFTGKTGKIDYSEAEKYFMMAALRGNATAQRNMGILYECGDVAVRDYRKAGLWFKASAINGNSKALKGYADVAAKGYIISDEEARLFIQSGYQDCYPAVLPSSDNVAVIETIGENKQEDAFFFLQLPLAEGAAGYAKARTELIINGKTALIDNKYTKIRIRPGENMDICYRSAYLGKPYTAANTFSVVNSVKPGETLYYIFTSMASFRPMNKKEIEIAKLQRPVVKSLVDTETPVAASQNIQQPAVVPNTSLTNSVVPVAEINKITVKKSAVDSSIPSTGAVADNTFAVIIANENYTSVSKVNYAANDGEVFSQYCHKTLGIPENHILMKTDATFGAIESLLARIEKIGSAYEGDINIIFYYAGHGIPDEKTRDSFIIPVDGDGSLKSTCVKTSSVYRRLADINAKSVVVFMDACFSGSARGDAMLASARGVRMTPKEETIGGRMVVFTASHGDETAYPYDEQGHGLFTYFLLKKLQETSGKVKLGDMMDYVQSSVKRESIVNCGQIQTPSVFFSDKSSDWREWQLR